MSNFYTQRKEGKSEGALYGLNIREIKLDSLNV